MNIMWIVQRREQYAWTVLYREQYEWIVENRKDGKKTRDGRKKTPHSWGVISQAKIRHKGKETFDKNQDGSPKNPKRTKLSKTRKGV